MRSFNSYNIHRYISIIPISFSPMQMYKIPLQKQGILPARDIEQLFPSLEELIHFHSGFCSQLKERVAPLKDGIVTSIADLLLQRVSRLISGCTFC